MNVVVVCFHNGTLAGSTVSKEPVFFTMAFQMVFKSTKSIKSPEWAKETFVASDILSVGRYLCRKAL